VEIRPRDAVPALGDDQIVVAPIVRRKGQAFDRFEVTATVGKKLALLSPEISYGLLSFMVMSRGAGGDRHRVGRGFGPHLVQAALWRNWTVHGTTDCLRRAAPARRADRAAGCGA
jgi:hypothetical protein